MIDQVHQFVVATCHGDFAAVLAVDDDCGYAVCFIPGCHVHGMGQHGINTKGCECVEYRVPVDVVFACPVRQLFHGQDSLAVLVDRIKIGFM